MEEKINMKKLLLFSFLAILTTLIYGTVNAQISFSDALKTCEPYTKQGSIEKNDEVFNLLITLEKSRNNKCTYKEKIYQDNSYQLLTCNFEPSQLAFMSKSMKKFSEVFYKQIIENPIFEAKMTTNGEVFQKYLANPKYCEITHSRR